MYNNVKHVLRTLGSDLADSQAYGEYKVWCPTHEDNKPSLHVTVQPDGNVLLHCFAGCKTQDVLERVGLGFEDLKAPGDRATKSLMSQVYTSYLFALPRSLSQEHYADMLLRANKWAISGYRSSTVLDSARAVKKLQELYDDDMIDAVPGFANLTPAVTTGLVIPIRDWHLNVVALQVRQYDREPKYVWFSGGRRKLAGAPVHVANVGVASDTLIVTEGALKADIVAQYTDKAVVGLPGVVGWPQLLDHSEIRRFKLVQLAVDMDWLYKESVYAQLKKMAHAFNQRRFHVEVLAWNPTFKGLDDWAQNWERYMWENMDAPLRDIKQVEQWREWGRNEWPGKPSGNDTTLPTSPSESSESPRESTSSSPVYSG